MYLSRQQPTCRFQPLLQGDTTTASTPLNLRKALIRKRKYGRDELSNREFDVEFRKRSRLKKTKVAFLKVGAVHPLLGSEFRLQYFADVLLPNRLPWKQNRGKESVICHHVKRIPRIFAGSENISNYVLIVLFFSVLFCSFYSFFFFSVLCCSILFYSRLLRRSQAS